MKSRLTGICLIISINLFSQNFMYLGGGMNFSFINIESLNFVVDRYNETRTDCSVFCLTETMNSIDNFLGGAASIGYVTRSGFTYEFTWAGRNRKTSATGVFYTGNAATRDVKIRDNSYNLGFGYTGFLEQVIRFGFLVSYDFGSFREFTRVSQDDFELVQKTLQLGMTFTLNLMVTGKKSAVGCAVRPYYQVGMFDVNFQELNMAINPTTAAADEDHNLKEKNHHPGIQVMVMILIGNN